MEYHVPVLLKECIEGLDIKPDGIYVDLTYGGGGHSREIIKYLDKGKLIGFDQDADATNNVIENDNFLFIQSNFKFFQNFLRYYKIGKVDGIMADLGISSHHINEPKRGFSFRFDGELDMRMDQQAVKNAEHVINTYSSEDLVRIFKTYGEIKNSYQLVKTIVNLREKKRIKTINNLIQVIENHIPKHAEHKYLARVFQALRIEVNNELEVLKETLQKTGKALKKEGRLVVLTYHSLEDRLVKNYMKFGNFEGKPVKDFYGNIIAPFAPFTRKVIVPGQNEIERNNRARSAKLRIAVKN